MNILNHQHYPLNGNTMPTEKPNSLADLIKRNFQASPHLADPTLAASVENTWLRKIIDSSHLITFCISISVIIYGSFRSLNIDVSKASAEAAANDLDHDDDDEDNEQYNQNFQSIQTIDSTQALIIPVAASISLLLMFFFFDSIQTAFLICTSSKSNDFSDSTI